MEHIKVNVASNYFVIGILEEMDLSMKLFELMMPNYFRGLFNAYKGKELDFERFQIPISELGSKNKL